MVKAENKDSHHVIIINDTLLGNHYFTNDWSSFLIDIQLTKFNQALASKPALSDDDFSRLHQIYQVAFLMALDATGNRDRALEIGNFTKKGQTDAIGKVVGIYKRRLISEGQQSDYDKAFELYSDALAISHHKDDKAQIYNHAINLAFLENYNANFEATK